MNAYAAGPFLSQIDFPEDLRAKFKPEELQQVSDELRQFIVEVDAMQRARRRAETRRRAEARRAAAAHALQPAAAAPPRVEPSTANASRGTGLVCLAPVCRGFM